MDVVNFFRKGRQDCRNVCLLSILSNKYKVAFIARILQKQQHGCAFNKVSAELRVTFRSTRLFHPCAKKTLSIINSDMENKALRISDNYKSHFNSHTASTHAYIYLKLIKFCLWRRPFTYVPCTTMRLQGFKRAFNFSFMS